MSDAALPGSSAQQPQDPALDVPRLLLKVGALTMRLEEAIDTIQTLQREIIQREQKIAELQKGKRSRADPGEVG